MTETTPKTVLDPVFQMIEHSLDAFVIFDVKTRVVIFENELAKTHFRITTERSNKDFFERIESQFQRREIALFPKTAMRDVNDNIVYCNIEAGYLDLEQQRIWAKITPVSTDIQQRRTMMQDDSELIFLEAIPRLYHDIIFSIDVKNKTLTHAGELYLQFGLPRIVEEFPHSMLEFQAIHPDDIDLFLRYGEGLLEGIVGEIQCRVRLLDNRYEWFQISTAVVRDYSGNLIEILGKLTNIEQQKRLEEVVSFDPLTSTLHSESFRELVEKALDDKESTFLFLDIDNFKAVNETFGHEFSDFVLGELVNRLKEYLGTADLLGRVERDQFTIFLRKVSDPSVVLRKVKQFIQATHDPIGDGKNACSITLSMGVSHYPQDGTNFNTLYQSSLNAMLTAKAEGGDKTNLCQGGGDYLEICIPKEKNALKNALGMLDNNISAFLVFNKANLEVVSENKKARDMFFTENHEFNLMKVFRSEENVEEIVKKLQKNLMAENVMTFRDVYLDQNDEETICCDLEFSYISDDKAFVYMKITEKIDKKLTLVKTLVEKIDKSIIVFFYDEKLSINFGNSAFYRDFSFDETGFFKNYGKSFLDLIVPEYQEIVLNDLRQSLAESPKGILKEPLHFISGETRWMGYDSEKMRSKDQEMKLYCELFPEPIQ